MANPLEHASVGADAGIRELVKRLDRLENRSKEMQASVAVVRSESDQTATRQMSQEAIEAAQNLQTDLETAALEIEAAKTELEQAKLDIAQGQTDLTQAWADATAAHGLASQATQDAQDAWNKAVEAETTAAAAETLVTQAAAVVRIDSSRGVLFKHNEVSTVLTVTVHKGNQIITDIVDLQSVYGPGAYLEWEWQRYNENTFGVISSADSRISNGGFQLTLGPADVDTKVVFRCKVNGDF